MKSLRIPTVLILLFFQSVPSVLADWRDEAEAAIYRNDHKTAFSLYLQKAKEGDALAQERVGNFYMFGWGTETDREEA